MLDAFDESHRDFMIFERILMIAGSLKRILITWMFARWKVRKVGRFKILERKPERGYYTKFTSVRAKAR